MGSLFLVRLVVVLEKALGVYGNGYLYKFGNTEQGQTFIKKLISPNK